MTALVFSIIGLVTGMSGLVVSLLSLRHNRMETVNAFLSSEREIPYIEAKKIVHNLPEKYDPVWLNSAHGEMVAVLVTMYQQAGILVRHRQLPLWLFTDQALGITTVILYQKLAPFFEWRRTTNNKLYAKEYEYLCKRICKKLKRSFGDKRGQGTGSRL